MFYKTRTDTKLSSLADVMFVKMDITVRRKCNVPMLDSTKCYPLNLKKKHQYAYFFFWKFSSSCIIIILRNDIFNILQHMHSLGHKYLYKLDVCLNHGTCILKSSVHLFEEQLKTPSFSHCHYRYHLSKGPYLKSCTMIWGQQV